MIASNVEQRILSGRPVLQGAGNGNALENIIPDPLPDGALVWVEDQAAYYVLHKRSTAAVVPPLVIATARGAGTPGRWVKMRDQSRASGSSFPFFGSNELDQNEFLMPFQQTVGTSSIPTGRRWVVPCDGYIVETFVQLSQAILVDAVFILRQHIEGGGDTDILTVTVPAGQTELVDASVFAQLRGYNIQCINTTIGSDIAVTTVVSLRFDPA